MTILRSLLMPSLPGVPCLRFKTHLQLKGNKLSAPSCVNPPPWRGKQGRRWSWTASGRSLQPWRRRAGPTAWTSPWLLRWEWDLKSTRWHGEVNHNPRGWQQTSALWESQWRSSCLKTSQCWFTEKKVNKQTWLHVWSPPNSTSANGPLRCVGKHRWVRLTGSDGVSDDVYDDTCDADVGHPRHALLCTETTSYCTVIMSETYMLVRWLTTPVCQMRRTVLLLHIRLIRSDSFTLRLFITSANKDARSSLFSPYQVGICRYIMFYTYITVNAAAAAEKQLKLIYYSVFQV